MKSKKESEHIVAGGLADDRIRRHTARDVNARIDECTDDTVERVTAEGPEAIENRLKELHREWDVERALIANFVVLGSVAHELGRRYHPGWTYFFRAQMGFLLMHAIVGWCPPLPVLRRLGFRTAKEISKERVVLMEHSAPSTLSGLGAISGEPAE